MRREYLIVRHPQPKPQDDWFMLDRWTPPAMHVVVSRYREIVEKGVVVDRIYRSCCSCGWRSREYHVSTQDRCPVAEALAERGERQPRGERLQWFDTKME